MLRILFFALLTVLYAALLAFPVQWLWNHFLPGALAPLAHVPLLNLWQAMGVVVIARLLHVLRLLGFLCGTLFWALLGGWLLKWAWNAWFVPGLHLPPLSWLQAGGILALLHLLFGSVGWFFHGPRHMRWHWERRQERERRREERREERLRRREEWRRWKREMKEQSGEWKTCHTEWGRWFQERPWYGMGGGKEFDKFWQERGRDAYEAWRRERDES